jgi:hypothetical protein
MTQIFLNSNGYTQFVPLLPTILKSFTADNFVIIKWKI